MAAKKTFVLCVLIGLLGSWCGAAEPSYRFEWQVPRDASVIGTLSIDLEGSGQTRSGILFLKEE